MDYYPLLRLAHIVGFIALGGGLLGVCVSELRAYRSAEVHRFAEAAWYTATFYDVLVLRGAVVVGLSGILLMLELGLGLFSEPGRSAYGACSCSSSSRATRSPAGSSSEPCGAPAERAATSQTTAPG